MAKHAYLIMAYNNWHQLGMLLHLLDYEENDIYLHIDKKSHNVPYRVLRESCKKSNLTIFSLVKVFWGGTRK